MLFESFSFIWSLALISKQAGVATFVKVDGSKLVKSMSRALPLQALLLMSSPFHQFCMVQNLLESLLYFMILFVVLLDLALRGVVIILSPLFFYILPVHQLVNVVKLWLLGGLMSVMGIIVLLPEANGASLFEELSSFRLFCILDLECLCSILLFSRLREFVLNILVQLLLVLSSAACLRKICEVFFILL